MLLAASPYSDTKGRSNNHMCRRHFLQTQKERGVDVIEPSSKDRKIGAVATPPSQQGQEQGFKSRSTRKKACAVKGCPKTSQVRRIFIPFQTIESVCIDSERGMDNLYKFNVGYGSFAAGWML